MPEDHQQERPTNKSQRSALEGGAAYAPNSAGALETAKKSSAGETGDDRTPDKPIGQVAYADGQKKQDRGGTGKPEISNLEPEKQGGIGGS